MEHETLTCPFCGAPYRETIPSGTVQVKCKYCAGTILIPPYLGGEVRRCPNHPDVLAVGLCNDCSGSYCDGCLYLYNVEQGVLHLCPNCFKERESDKAAKAFLSGVLAFFLGFLFIGISQNSGMGVTIALILGGFFGFPFIAYGVYKSVHLPEGVTLKERTEAVKAELEARKAFGAQASTSELYGRLLSDTMRNYGPSLGAEILERRIDHYVFAGKSRNEAIKKLAEEAGYYFQS